MKKTWLSLVLALALCLGLAAPVAAAGGPEPLPHAGQIWVNKESDIGAFVIRQNGDLWLYRIDDDATGYSSTYITDNAKQVLANALYFYLLKNNGDLFYGPWPQAGDETTYQFNNPKIADHVEKFGYWGGALYTLKDDGNLYTYKLPYNEPGTLFASGVKDITVDDDGYYRGYLTDSRANMLNDDQSCSLDGGAKLYYLRGAIFAITEEGDLWSLGGVNTFGECGNGGLYSYYHYFYVGSAPSGPVGTRLSADLVCHRSTKLLPNVEELYYDPDTWTFIAVQKDGTAWSWGNAEAHTAAITAVDSSGNMTRIGDIRPPADMSGYSPEQLSAPLRQAKFWDGSSMVTAQSDGTLIYTNTSLRKTLSLPNWFGGDSPAPVPGSPASAFADVAPGDWFYEPVGWAVEQGITTGTSANTFSPEATCTQAQILTFLWRAKGSPAPAGALSSHQYYAQAAQWALEQGIIEDFEADTPCTRAMVVTYLWRLAGCPDAAGSQFADVPADAGYTQAVAWAVEEGITSGTSAITFSPDTTCTRGQIVTFLYRALGN